MAKAQYTELPPWERAAHYRQMAAETEALGENGTPEFRASCREFALRWRKLADELTSRDFEDLEDGPEPRNPEKPEARK